MQLQAGHYFKITSANGTFLLDFIRPGLDFEIQKLGKHLGVHSTLSENTHL